MFDIRKMRWSEEIADVLNLPLDKLPRIVKPWDIIGELTQDIAEKCGLVTGIPIAAGAGDYTASSLGTGLTRPSLCIDVAGTASVLAVSTTDITPDKKYRTLLYVKSIVPELWQVGAYINGGGLCLRWFRDEFGKYEKERAKEINVDPYKLLDEEASKVPEGSEGLIFIPHLGGRAYPNQPDIKGIWFGFTWKHTVGHFFRSIMEGIAYEYYHYMKIAKSLFRDLQLEEIRRIGGGSKSRIWAQIKAETLNIPYVLLDKEEYAALALAVIGGYAVGAIKDYKQAIDKWVKPVARIEPQPKKHEMYKRYAEFYEHLLYFTNNIFNEHARLF